MSLERLTAATLRRCRAVHETHDHVIPAAWPVEDQLAVALVLEFGEHLAGLGHTTASGIAALAQALPDLPEDVPAWLEEIRAALRLRVGWMAVGDEPAFPFIVDKAPDGPPPGFVPPKLDEGSARAAFLDYAGTERFAEQVVQRCRMARDVHDGRIDRGWSLRQQLVVALVLRDHGHLASLGYSIQGAEVELINGMARPPSDLDSWLDGIRHELGGLEVVGAPLDRPTLTQLRIEIEVEGQRWNPGGPASAEVDRAGEIVDLVQRTVVRSQRIHQAPATIGVQRAESPAVPPSPMHTLVTIELTVSVIESRWRDTAPAGSSTAPLAEELRSHVAETLAANGRFADTAATITVTVIA
ncbi:hypothetical protein SAMN04489732_12929 [Amycolatopsis saalfeldensis]|uniref:Uncharacterized protein n=1 Tax=Amycolatopsis saalfeldensis TaxID=394193 RepID=A0A1H8YN29_9PSEU|nr:hypothetical protein SAMN04489732_12929 [Amycolatopsis saalfeldensis]